MTDDSNPHMFLIFFLTLAGCSLLSLPVTWCVRDKSILSQLPAPGLGLATVSKMNKGFDNVE